MKTEKMVGTCVIPQLVIKESNLRANERKKKICRPRELFVDWLRLTKKEYAMDYSQLKRMVEDKTAWHR